MKVINKVLIYMFAAVMAAVILTAAMAVRDSFVYADAIAVDREHRVWVTDGIMSICNSVKCTELTFHGVDDRGVRGTKVFVFDGEYRKLCRRDREYLQDSIATVMLHNKIFTTEKVTVAAVEL